MIVVSQSGETADTLASLRYAKEQGQQSWQSSMCRHQPSRGESDVVMPTIAGPEIGVGVDQGIYCQLATLACIAIAAGRARGYVSQEAERRLVDALMGVPV